MEREKITLSKACKLLGVYGQEGRDTIRLEYEAVNTDKPWISFNDWLWGKLQKMVVETNGAPEIYWMMSQFVSRFEGKSGLLYDKLAIEARLKQDINKLNSKNVEWVAVVIGDQKCKHGKKKDKQTFPLMGDYNPANLAGKNCEKMSCICHYSIVQKKNDKGEIIFKTSTGKIINF